MCSFVRRSFAACDRDAGLGNGASLNASTWPSRNATLANPPGCRKCVVGWGLPTSVANGAAIEYDSCAVGGLVQVAISAESEKTNVADVDWKSRMRRGENPGGVDRGGQEEEAHSRWIPLPPARAPQNA